MKILVIAPHADDEVLGVGGTIAKRVKEGADIYVCIVTRGREPLYSEESVRQIRNESEKAGMILNVKNVYFLDFPAVMLETVPRYDLNEKIGAIIQKVEPDEVYIPHIGDMQKDHQLVTDAAMVALRPKYNQKIRRIYAYETLSETGWNIPNVQNEFIPNVYEDISETLEIKKQAMRCYQSQVADFPNPRSIEAIDALAKYRGATVCREAAEAFQLIREIK